MAKTLKSTGLTNLLFLIGANDNASPSAVQVFKATGLDAYDGSDDDSKDTTATVEANKTTTGVTYGTNTWKGTTIGYFKPSTTQGVIFPTGGDNRPSLRYWATIVVLTTSSKWSVASEILQDEAGGGLYVGNSPARCYFRSNTVSDDGTISDGTKHISAFVLNNTGSNLFKYWYGAESGSTVTNDGTGDCYGFSFNYTHRLTRCGMASDGNGWNGEIYLVAAFNDLLSQATIESILADPEGYFFETGGGSAVPVLMQHQQRNNASAVAGRYSPGAIAKRLGV